VDNYTKVSVYRTVERILFYVINCPDYKGTIRKVHHNIHFVKIESSDNVKDA